MTWHPTSFARIAYVSIAAVALGGFFGLASPASALTCGTSAPTLNDHYSFGNGGGQQMLAGNFTASADCTVTNLKSEGITYGGTPADSVEFSVYSDSSGSPGARIGNWCVPGSNWAGSDTLSDCTSDGSITLVSGTQYWFVIGRTGAQGSPFYRTHDGYPASGGGVLQAEWDGSSWAIANVVTLGFEVDGTTSGGGGGPAATTTVDTAAFLYTYAVWTYLASFFGMVTLMLWIRR